MQASLAFPWHVDFNVNLPPADAHDVNATWKVHVDLDVVAILVIRDFQAALAKAPFLRNYAYFNGFLIPRFHVDICVRGFNPQIGPVGDGVSL
jgi:hypothetical protein